MAALGHTVRVRQCHQQSSSLVNFTERSGAGAFVYTQQPPELARQLPRTAQRIGIDLTGQAAAFVGAFQPLQPGAQVGIAWTSARQHIAFCQQGGQVRSERAMPEFLPAQQHMGEAWVNAERGHGAAMRRNAVVVADGTQPAEHLPCLGEPCRWRWVQQGQGVGILHAPAGQFQSQGREVCFQQFRSRSGRQRLVCFGGPQAMAFASARTACATLALVCSRARDAAGGEPAHPAHRVEARAACHTAVDDHGDAIDSQRSFSNAGCQYHLASAGHGWPHGEILFRCGQVAVERPQVRVGWQSALLQGTRDAADFRGTGEEHQQVAFARLGQYLQYFGCDFAQRVFRCALGVVH